MNRGFTLIEMLVVMAIFAILTTVTLASNSNFGTRITLETLAAVRRQALLAS